MADSELGELRRSPRMVQQRLERMTAARTRGMAGGSSDALAPADDGEPSDSGFVEDGIDAVAAVPTWFAETCNVTSSSTDVTLTYEPFEYSEILRLNNDFVLIRDVDYTIAGRVVTFDDPATLLAGIGGATWVIAATYPYTGETTETLIPDLVNYGETIDGSFTLGTQGDQDGFDDCDLAVVITTGDSTTPSGLGASWTRVINGTGTDAIDVWLGTGTLTGNDLTLGTSTWGCAYAFQNINGTVSVRNSSTSDLTGPHTPYSGSFVDVTDPSNVTAVLDDIVVVAALGRIGTSDAFYPNSAAPPDGAGTSVFTGLDAYRSTFALDPDNPGSGPQGGLLCYGGFATATTVTADWEYIGDPDGGTTLGTGQMLNLVLQVTP